MTFGTTLLDDLLEEAARTAKKAGRRILRKAVAEALRTLWSDVPRVPARQPTRSITPRRKAALRAIELEEGPDGVYREKGS